MKLWQKWDNIKKKKKNYIMLMIVDDVRKYGD